MRKPARSSAAGASQPSPLARRSRRRGSPAPRTPDGRAAAGARRARRSCSRPGQPARRRHGGRPARASRATRSRAWSRHRQHVGVALHARRRGASATAWSRPRSRGWPGARRAPPGRHGAAVSLRDEDDGKRPGAAPARRGGPAGARQPGVIPASARRCRRGTGDRRRGLAAAIGGGRLASVVSPADTRT